MISLIWSMDKNRLIGNENGLPWRIPADLAYFRRITSGHTVIMGRKTYESIGKPLPNRHNVIITKDPGFSAEGCSIYHSIEEVLSGIGEEEAFIIGGSSIYKQFLPYADKLYITFIEEEFQGDSYFPEFDWKNWELVSKEKGDRNEKNSYDYYFSVYIKRTER